MARCGPFELDAPLGAGGMATVWRAHLGSAAVAIKFVDLPTERARQQFAQEVRAVAALDHPGIVQVLDHGVHEDRPWMALELASGGSLTGHLDTLDWERTRVVLLALLDALAHAHAHGVVHRDLKPGNVLWSTLDDPRPGLKLADFGIAHLLHDADPTGERQVAGTPSVLAPEQCRASVPEYGPWTDLYALGCLATRMVTGRYPFRGRSLPALMRAHLGQEPPPIDGALRFDAPGGLQTWLDRLLAKAPRDRYRSATDAADALAALEPLPSAPIEGALGVTRSRVLAEPRQTDRVRRDWRQPDRPPFPRRYVQAGLATLPLRTPRTVERDEPADAVFDLLEEVRTSGRPHVVLVEGAPGVGRSHFGRWLARRAEERGMAWAFEATVTPDASHGAWLHGLLARVTRTDGVPPAEVPSTLDRALSVWGPLPATTRDLLVGVLDGTVSAPEARHGSLRGLLGHRAADRPAWLWIDDALDDPEVVAFVGTVLDASAPILVVLDIGEGGSTPDPFFAHPRVRRVALSDLSEAAMGQLIASALPLAPALAKRLVEAARGRPAITMHHLHGLAASARLTPALEGFVVDGPWEPSPVHTASDAASLRLRALLADADARQTRALAIAAVLGTEVDRALWARAVERQGDARGAWVLPLADARAWSDLEERMVRAGDASPTARGWRFAGALRDAVLRHLDEGVLREARRSVARTLAATEPPGNPVRIARLHRGAGDLDLALAVLEGAVLDAHPALRGAVGANACTEALQLADALRLAPDDPRREPFHARRLLGIVEDDGGAEHARDLLAVAALRSWPLVAATAHASLAALASAERDPVALERHLEAARAAVEALPVSTARADVENLIAWTLYRAERFDEARAVLDRVMAAASEHGWAGISAYAQMIDSGVRRVGGHPLPLAEVAQRAETLSAQGWLSNAASVWVDAGEQARAAGDLDASDAFNARAAEALVLVGNAPVAPHVNRAVNAFLRGDAPATRRWLDRAVLSDPRPEWTVPMAGVELAWASLLDDPEVARERLSRLERALRQPGLALTADDHLALRGAARHLAGRAPALAERIEALLSRQ